MRARILAALALCCAWASALAAGGPLQREARFDLPVQPLADALLALAQQADVELVVVGDTGSAASRAPVSGRMTVVRALSRMLDPAIWQVEAGEAGLVLVTRRSRSARVSPAPPAAPAAPVVDAPGLRVTARRREESRLDVPMSVQRLYGGTIAALGIDNVATALDLVPGVTAVDHGRGFTLVQIRGISSSLGSNENGYYLDGVAFTGATVPWYPDAATFDLDHIEVLKGPQGTLFGEGSLGGTVRIQTRAPQLHRFEALAAGRVSSTGGGDGGWGWEGMVNLPLGDRAAARLVATRSHSGGWVGDAGRPAIPINHHDRDVQRARLRIEPHDRIAVDLGWWRHGSSSPGGGYGARDDGTTPAHYGSDSTWTVAGGRASAQLAGSDVELGISRASLDDHARGELLPGAGYAGDIDIDIEQVELRWSSLGGETWDWTAGYAWRRVRRSDVTRLDDARGAASQHSCAHALFTEANWRLPRTRLALSAGARYFNDTVQSHSRSQGRETRLDAIFATWSPRLGLSYRPGPHRQWYASYARGFRSGQLQPARSLVSAAALGIELPVMLDPDTVDTVEAGYRHEVPARGLHVEASIHHSNWRNVPVRQPLEPGLNGLVSVRGARSRGIDLALGWRTRGGLELRHSVSRVDAVYRASIPGTPIQHGAPVYNVPDWSLATAATRRWELGNGTPLAFAAWVQWLAPRDTGLLVAGRGEPLVLSGARIEWEPVPDHRLGWSVGNLFGEDGAIDARDAYGVAMRPRPRTWEMSWQVAF